LNENMSASPICQPKYSRCAARTHRAANHVYALRDVASTHRLCRLFCRARRGGAREEASQMTRMLALVCAVALSAGAVMAPALAQQSAAPVLPYGASITLDQAKRAMAAAELEAAKNSWQVAITILDSGGTLVMFHKFDNAQLSAVTVSEGKARTALEFKRPSKDLDDAIAGGGAGLRLLALKNITPIEGGIPIVVDGKIIGAIGASGALSSQDAQVAKAGADALTK
jgi:glc operon protein GlcG